MKMPCQEGQFLTSSFSLAPSGGRFFKEFRELHGHDNGSDRVKQRQEWIRDSRKGLTECQTFPR